jgi:uncharacterized membrane protein
MKKILLYLAVALGSGLFFTNIYNSVVNAANWESQIPQSVLATREFFTVANPGTFFQFLDPANLLVVLLSILVHWKTKARYYLIAALVCFAGSMVMTFTYFYPRNEVLFLTETLPPVDTLEKAAKEWGRMNWVRSGLWLCGVVLAFWALEQRPNEKKGPGIAKT